MRLESLMRSETNDGHSFIFVSTDYMEGHFVLADERHLSNARFPLKEENVLFGMDG